MREEKKEKPEQEEVQEYFKFISLFLLPQLLTST